MAAIVLHHSSGYDSPARKSEKQRAGKYQEKRYSNMYLGKVKRRKGNGKMESHQFEHALQHPLNEHHTLIQDNACPRQAQQIGHIGDRKEHTFPVCYHPIGWERRHSIRIYVQQQYQQHIQNNQFSYRDPRLYIYFTIIVYLHSKTKYSSILNIKM
jgi:hypothetical protein